MELNIQMNTVPVASLAEFRSLENRCHNMQKPTTFVLQSGTGNHQEFVSMLDQTDAELTAAAAASKTGYCRVKALDSFIPGDEMKEYIQRYQSLGQQKIDLPFHFDNGLWNQVMAQAFIKITGEFRGLEPAEQRNRNFVILLLHWIKLYFPKLFLTTKGLSKFPKFIYTGPVRTREYLFCKLLALCGCDVYCIDPADRFEIKVPDISYWAQVVMTGQAAAGSIPDYDPQRRSPVRQQPKAASEAAPMAPPRSTSPPPLRMPQASVREVAGSQAASERRKLEYEELAAMASSIVMITVYNDKQEPFATGSGVIIQEKGYVLTNFHVISGGAFFGIRLEEQEELIFTAELIKYHTINDLALLRVEGIHAAPIRLPAGGKLVRGQKVVAIGSPLGLFNTVSEGIIAGFRELREVPMIQFTAPTSHGSSGGALLNLYGELIGIVTAGFDDGQNLNLAVDYQTVALFLKGFV